MVLCPAIRTRTAARHGAARGCRSTPRPQLSADISGAALPRGLVTDSILMHCPGLSDALTQGLKYVISSRAALPNGKMRLTKLALTRLAALGSRSRTARTVAMGARPAPLAAPPEERSAARGVCFAALRSSRTVEPVSPWGDKRTPQRGEFRRTPKPSSRGAVPAPAGGLPAPPRAGADPPHTAPLREARDGSASTGPAAPLLLAAPRKHSATRAARRPGQPRAALLAAGRWRTTCCGCRRAVPRAKARAEPPARLSNSRVATRRSPEVPLPAGRGRTETAEGKPRRAGPARPGPLRTPTRAPPGTHLPEQRPVPASASVPVPASAAAPARAGPAPPAPSRRLRGRRVT